MLAMVFGCNLGTAMNPLIQSLRGDPASRRVPVGNVANRLIGCLIGLALLPLLVPQLRQLPISPLQVAAFSHLAFNLVMALAFLVPLPVIAGLLTRCLPDVSGESDPARSRYLDRAALREPAVALSNATREVLRMADVVDEMLSVSRDAFASDDAANIAQIGRADDVLDSLYNQIQLYVGAIRHETLSKLEEERLVTILSLAINLEHVGDIIKKNLMQMADKRIRDRRRLPADALDRIAGMHARLSDHLRLAVNVFISQDEEMARRLIREKETFRDLEQEAVARHLAQMRTGSAEALAVSALQLDITRDLKRIDAHIAATVHGLLERRGLLQRSRLLLAAA